MLSKLLVKGLDKISYDKIIVKDYRAMKNESYFGARGVRDKNHINGIECFWSYAKRRIKKFNGFPEHKLLFHLKEC